MTELSQTLSLEKATASGDGWVPITFLKIKPIMLWMDLFSVTQVGCCSVSPSASSVSFSTAVLCIALACELFCFLRQRMDPTENFQVPVIHLLSLFIKWPVATTTHVASHGYMALHGYMIYMAWFFYLLFLQLLCVLGHASLLTDNACS